MIPFVIFSLQFGVRDVLAYIGFHLLTASGILFEPDEHDFQHLLACLSSALTLHSHSYTVSALVQLEGGLSCAISNLNNYYV